VRSAWVIVALTACEGQITLPRTPVEPPPVEPSTPVGDGWPTFAATSSFQLRRLTTEQIVNSARTLLGASTAGMPPIEPVAPVAGYASIGAATTVVSSDGVAKFEDAARFLAHLPFASAQKAAFAGCTPSSVSDTACFRSFVVKFGKRAF